MVQNTNTHMLYAAVHRWFSLMLHFVVAHVVKFQYFGISEQLKILISNAINEQWSGVCTVDLYGQLSERMLTAPEQNRINKYLNYFFSV